MKRNILLYILGLEGIGGISGGLLLLIAPDGSLLQMPVGVMHGIFPNFLIPGLLLTGLGIITLSAFMAVFKRNSKAWLLSGLSLVGYTIWFIVEIIVLQQINWLHIVSGFPVLIGIWAALPLIPSQRQKIFNKDNIYE